MYCRGERCRSRARRRRSRGLPSSAYPDGWRRGRLRFGARSKLELELEAAREEERRALDPLRDRVRAALAEFEARNRQP
jgi:hypothetical protein